MNPQNGQVLALASFPNYDLNEWVGGISAANFAALQTERGGERRGDRGAVHAGLDVQARHRHRRARRTASSHPPRRTSTPGRSRSTGARHAGVVADTGCTLHDDPGDTGGTYNVSSALTASSDAFFYNLGEQFWEQQSKFGPDADPERGHRVRRGHDHRHRPPRRGPGPGGQQPHRGPSCTPRHPRPSPTPASWFTGDNIEMAFGQGETVVTPIEQAVAYSTFANGGTRYAPQVASQVVDPSIRQRHQEARAAGHREGGDLAGQLQRHAGGVRRCHLEQERNGLPGFPGLPDLVEPRRKNWDRFESRPERTTARAEQLVRGLRPEPQSAVTWSSPSSTRVATAPRPRPPWCATSSTTSWPTPG